MTDQVPPAPSGQKNLDAFQALLEVDEKERSFKERQGYITAYLLSLLLPPLGVYFCVKYLFFSNRTPDDIRAGLVSLGLAAISLFFSLWMLGLLLGKTAIQNSTDLDTLKQFVTPENMKQFKDLMQ